KDGANLLDLIDDRKAAKPELRDSLTHFSQSYRIVHAYDRGVVTFVFRAIELAALTRQRERDFAHRITMFGNPIMGCRERDVDRSIEHQANRAALRGSFALLLPQHAGNSKCARGNRIVRSRLCVLSLLQTKKADAAVLFARLGFSRLVLICRGRAVSSYLISRCQEFNCLTHG